MVGDFQLGKMEGLHGDVSYVLIRGEKKIGYSLKMKITVSQGDKHADITFTDFNEHKDYEVKTPHQGHFY